ncbi:YnfA/UPF0060 family uncharacterized protein [Luteibacter rhizovicinus]|uniref:YnfA/UPF0060 family uncharacterized protein n=1 Tax=Luteibacter rhizovicinus TaxID=242606 RepID=A0A4R3YY71_9GAMM|nr:YnfA/UPF0060 family uncharacterized protein [Luteibacter rhizovicinus]
MVSKAVLIYVLAAIAEIAGCFGFWVWQRQHKTAWIAVAAMGSLALFAWLLSRTDTDAAGRAYAAYGGVYIAASLLGFG